MEIDWGGKPNYTSYGCPVANWKGHETHNSNHMNESLLSGVDCNRSLTYGTLLGVLW